MSASFAVSATEAYVAHTPTTTSHVCLRTQVLFFIRCSPLIQVRVSTVAQAVRLTLIAAIRPTAVQVLDDPLFKPDHDAYVATLPLEAANKHRSAFAEMRRDDIRKAAWMHQHLATVASSPLYRQARDRLAGVLGGAAS